MRDGTGGHGQAGGDRSWEIGLTHCLYCISPRLSVYNLLEMQICHDFWRTAAWRKILEKVRPNSGLGVPGLQVWKEGKPGLPLSASELCYPWSRRMVGTGRSLCYTSFPCLAHPELTPVFFPRPLTSLTSQPSLQERL